MKNKRVLIVDDNDLNRKLFENLLGQLYQIDSANNGLQALEKMEKNPFDLVLMDMQMPVMNGIEATIEIRKLQNRKKAKVPIVAMTANAGKAEIQACMDAGMNDSLIKPFALSSLVSLLNHFLQLSVDVKN